MHEALQPRVLQLFHQDSLALVDAVSELKKEAKLHLLAESSRDLNENVNKCESTKKS